VAIVYDVSNRDSFDRVKEWIESINLTKKENIDMILIGNKTDLKNRSISNEEGRSLARSYSIPYEETSAKDNKNISEAFSKITSNIIKKRVEAEQFNIRLKKNDNFLTLIKASCCN
jgi:small GTP-binding protein